MRPVIVIGAPRSGTNLLRDLLCRLPGVGSWPCDEINPIWRHGNVFHPTDELGPEHATDAVRRHVRRAFEKVAARQHVEIVVEKTCANSLRVPFVRAIFPEAAFIFLIRDGRDATASAIGKWEAPLDLAYTLRKTRFVPPMDLPIHLFRFFALRLRKLLSRESRLATWGPRFAGMDRIVREKGVAAACAMQWVRCVESAWDGLRDIESERLLVVRYWDLATRPVDELLRMARFLDRDLDEREARAATSHVTSAKIGAWESLLPPEDRDTVQRILDSVRMPPAVSSPGH